MIEIKHNTLKLRNQDSLAFESVPGLVLGVDANDIIPTIEGIVEEVTAPVIEEVTNSTIAENSYLKDGDEIKQLIFEMTYPIGKIIHTTKANNPSTYLGGGTWEQIKDVFLLAAGDTYTAGSTGGEAEHTLTVDEMPSHSHKVMFGEYDVTHNIGAQGTYWNNIGIESNTTLGNVTAVAVGGDQPHNNMPPYKTVYIWERTA